MFDSCGLNHTVLICSKLSLFQFPFIERKQEQLRVQGHTEDGQGIQTDDVILVMNSSSSFRVLAALK